MKPILTVVTRHMPNHRPLCLARLNESLDPMRQFIQHLVVEDKDAGGLRRSGELVVAQKEKVKGHFVWILDDDDECTCAHLPQILERAKDIVNPDVIIVRGWYQLHGILPTNKHWITKNIHEFIPPVPGTTDDTAIGMPGFILRNEVYQRHIDIVATVDKWLDQALLSSIQQGAKEYKYKVYYIDILVMRQAVGGGGRPEKFHDPTQVQIVYGRTENIYEKLK